MKKLLAIITSLAVVLAMMPSVAFATEGEGGGENTSGEPPAATTGTVTTVNTFDALQTAIDGAEDGDSIELSADINILNTSQSKKITMNKDADTSVTLKMNGKTITSTEVDDVIYVTGGTLKITGNGKIINTANAGCTIVASGENAKIIIENGDYSSNATGNVTLIDANTNAIVEINGGTFTANSGGAKDGKVLYAGANYDEPSVAAANKVPGKIIVNGGNFAGRLSDSNWGQYEIKGGTFDRCTIAHYVYNNGYTNTANPNNVDANNYRTITESYSIVGAGINMISDGYIMKKNSDTEYVVIPKNNLGVGVYLTDPEGFLAADGSLAIEENSDLFEVKSYEAKIGDTNYEIFAAAILSATEGNCIELLKDITISNTSNLLNGSVIKLEKNIIIDGKGYSIIADRENWKQVSDTNGPKATSHILGVENGAEVTIKNLTIIGNEKTKHGINVWTQHTPESNNRAKATLENVTIKNCGAAGMVVANSIVKATNLKTSGNAWGAVNIDKGTPQFTLISGTLAEENKVWTELEGDKLNGIILPNYWQIIKIEDGKTYYAYVAPVYYPPAPPADPITNDSGNTAAGDAPSTTLDTKPVTTTTDGVKTTTGAVDTATGEKLVEKAVANKSEEVVVDVTTTNTDKAAKTEVTIPTSTVNDIADKTEAAVEIKTDNAVVSLDNEAIKEVAKQAGETGEVKLVVETVKSDADEVIIEVKLETSNGAVTNFGAGNVKVTVPVTEELKGKTVVCVYIDDEGNYTKMEGMLNADGTYTFVTNHFSTYAIMEEEVVDAKIAEQNKASLEVILKDMKFKASTKYTSKKNVKVTAKVLKGDISDITDMGYTVKYKFYRSEKKSSKYALKATKTTDTYTNTAGKKGKKYYYKVRLAVYDGDMLVGETELKQSEYGVRTWKK